MAKTKYLMNVDGRECAKCNEFKSWEHYSKNCQQKSGHTSQCKQCSSNRTDWIKYNADQAIERRKNPAVFRTRHLKSKLRSMGVTLEYFNDYVDTHNNQCEICGINLPSKQSGEIREITGGPKGTKQCIDHNHITGKFRGILCGHCNLMLGHAKDNIDTLQKAIKYLQQA